MGGTFLRHDLLHDLVAKNMFGDEHEMVSAARAVRVPESERQHEFASKLSDGCNQMPENALQHFFKHSH